MPAIVLALGAEHAAAQAVVVDASVRPHLGALTGTVAGGLLAGLLLAAGLLRRQLSRAADGPAHRTWRADAAVTDRGRP